MERVVLGFDDSPAAHGALDWVIDRARLGDLRVQVVLVANMFLSDTAVDEDALARADERLRASVPGIPVETIRLDGLMPSTLIDVAKGADLLVMGVDGGRPVRAALHGWLPQRTSAHAPVPVCVVPRGWTAVDGPVTAGLADDDSSIAALDFAAAEAEHRSRAVHIVHSWHGPLPGSNPRPMSRRQIHNQHRDLATAAAGRIEASHPGLEVHVELTQANPVAALAAAGRVSSLVVIGTHGRGLLSGGLVGSVGQDLVGSANAPLCVVPVAP